MPTYDYQCRACGSVTEVIHSMLEDGPSVCERCGGELRRVLYPTGIIFKGSGFYRTDSRADTGSASSKPADAKPAKSESAGSTDGGTTPSSSGDSSGPKASSASTSSD